MAITNQRFMNLLSLSTSSQMTKSNHETKRISNDNNYYFIDGFHGLYLLSVKSYSFQFLFSFRVEHMKKSLKTM